MRTPIACSRRAAGKTRRLLSGCSVVSALGESRDRPGRKAGPGRRTIRMANAGVPGRTLGSDGAHTCGPSVGQPPEAPVG
jgi:hypothetical protein